eukprot:CAMPEP_0203927286 /NCGR_PEP_ID=MMETSP0359-20131031/66717_1 /ASSEMBLY_ACC=CAM_ASM_000338 /TAXON_ID=268821 /ORGANISM="Scrippsiella Hangoei, Strain SHTV-5" /LENGTH=143 /DNA_ID=CAMNT_0050856023 /DNA_START=85 /DNA_END=512 /DNA_ORIENTATION=+
MAECGDVMIKQDLQRGSFGARAPMSSRCCDRLADARGRLTEVRPTACFHARPSSKSAPCAPSPGHPAKASWRIPSARTRLGSAAVWHTRSRPRLQPPLAVVLTEENMWDHRWTSKKRLILVGPQKVQAEPEPWNFHRSPCPST